jgi:hypothetical protein
MMEAPSGFEPEMEVLQTGTSAFRHPRSINDLAEMLRESHAFASTTITRITP